MSLADAVSKLQTSLADESPYLPYIKDWHLVHQSRTLSDPGDRVPYQTPSIFMDDWLNNAPEGQDDFRFCYAGVAGSFTPMHRDIYTSYSWSTNISGIKQWYLLPPDVAYLLRRDPSNRRSEIIYDVRGVDETIFQGWKEAQTHVICVQQQPGQTIFVPSGWYHQVINITDCISLNQNWCNSCNLSSLYAAMKDAVEEVAEAISDVRQLLEENWKRASVKGKPARATDTTADVSGWRVEWLREVDKLLKMDAGWGWEQFFAMISYNICEEHMAAPEIYRPPTSFVRDRVNIIIEDFVQREEYSLLPEIRSVVDDVRYQLQTCDNTRRRDLGSRQ